MKRAVLAVITSAVLGGCATVDRNTTFDGSDGNAFVLVAADNVPDRGVSSHSFVFSRVDLQSSTFLPEWFSITFDGGAGTFVVDELKKPEGLNTTLRFGARSVVPGDYAYAARRDLQGNLQTEHCYAKGAGVFRIVAGKTNVISLGDVLNDMGSDPDVALDQGATILTAYPKISAPLVQAQQVGSITFPPAKSLGWEGCLNRNVTALTVISATP
ncbi:hypothetical protein ACPEH1_11265 [Stenotrophomonas sp. NPDC077421]|uniref:hypothetical protein n=1 Tax=unclassified Stenotrophomonas TaxID=196198 RepID=UPI0028AF3DC0|nr:hypothetical protein [Stenotrophomonas sp.]